MIAALIEQYKQGKITAGQTAVQLVQMIDPTRPELVLQGLPTEILVRIQGFAREYHPNGMVTNYGILPTQDQVEAARKWIEANLHTTSPL